MLKVISTIKKASSAQFASEETVQNSFSSVSTGQNPPDFVVDYEDVKHWVLDETSGAAFTLDITSLINSLDAEVTFIHIQSHLHFENVGDTEDPARFNLNVDGVDWGNMSQFQVGNAESFARTQVTVSNVVIPTGKKGLLTIIVGSNKA